MKKELAQLMATGKTEEVLDRLHTLAEHADFEDLSNEILLHTTRYREYAKEKRQGTSTQDEQQVILTRINHALIQIINQLPDDATLGQVATDSTPESASQKRTVWQWIVGAGVVIGILAGVARITGYDLKTLFGTSPVANPLQLTVYVHGPAGKQDIVLENQGQLLLDLRNDRRTAQVGEHGRTNFGEISSDFLGQEIPLTIQAEGYVMACPDSSYVYNGDPIYLAVKPNGELGIVQGKVLSRDGSRLLDNVRIEVVNQHTFTDSLGNFHLTLPEELWQQDYLIYANKDGYQPKQERYYPKLDNFQIRLLPQNTEE